MAKQTKNQKYDHKKVEAKWQKEWKRENIYSTPKQRSLKKKYVLDMFPYPSGATMHVGHLEGYIGTDMLSRFFRMTGYAVLHPMGWDAFGLPAENYAIKTGIHPDKSTHDNIKVFKRQLENAGLSYDWEREIDTSDPDFYRWTQWLFILLFKKGLAYKKKAPVNWCPKDETVLADEQVVEGKCERCDTPVIQKELEQWFFKITAYADRLISGLDGIDWLEDVKVQQKNWIGRSSGLEIKFPLKGKKVEISVWTKYWETIFGATFLVVSPSYFQKNLGELIPPSNKKEVEKYIKMHINVTKTKHNKADKEKSGVFSGIYAVNPANGVEIPVWVADYVLDEVGTGAVMGVPAHDSRDFEFAKKYSLVVLQVVSYKDSEIDKKVAGHEISFEGEGKLVNSAQFDGLDAWGEGKAKIAEWMVKEGIASRSTTYHLRDWLISRQRYWGCPIPMIYCESCKKKDGQGWRPVPEDNLPVILPTDVDFLPHGESPIARSNTFQEGVTCPVCGKPADREVDTMDTYVDSSWYFIRFVDPQNKKEFASNADMKNWLPVDVYVGGGHVVQHLLFSRFLWKVLYDEGLLPKGIVDEPFLKLRAPGWILGPDSRKMSKRWGNVITPDDIIPKFGADVLRLYEMFMGPFDVVKPWSLTGVEGMSRFLNRVWKLYQSIDESTKDSKEVLMKLHQTIKKISEGMQDFRYNTAIAAMMELANLLESKKGSRETMKTLIKLLAPFAPHIAEEMWVNVLGQKFSVHNQKWPEFDASEVQEQVVNMIIQVNGKLRGTIGITKAEAHNKEFVESKAKKKEKVSKWIEGKKVRNVIFVPGRLINFVVS